MAEMFLLVHSMNFQELAQGGSVLPSNSNKQFSVLGVLGALTLEFIPGQFSFSVVVGVRGEDFSKGHTVRITFGEAVDEKDPIVDSGEISISPKKENNNSQAPFMIMGAQLANVIFKNSGEYRTRVFWDGQLLGNAKIPVVQRHAETD